MKQIISSILFLVFFSQNVFGNLNILPTEQERQSVKSGEMLKDPSFEIGGGNAVATTTQPTYQGLDTSGVKSTNCLTGRCLGWNPSGSDILYFISKKVPAKMGGVLHGQCQVSLIDDTHTYTLELYDYTNSLLLKSVSLPADASGNFTLLPLETTLSPSASERDIRLRIQDTANEANIYIDDCSTWIDNKNSVGTVDTPWALYTPTFTGFGTVSVQSFYWRRVGSNLEILGKWTAGTSTSTEARISFPNSLVSSSILSSPMVVGIVNWSEQSTTYFSAGKILAEPSVGYITFSRETSTTNGLTKQNGNTIQGSGVVASMQASIPILGWDASLNITSEQADWRVDANISGANPGLSSGNITSWSEITDTGLTLTNNTSKGSLSSTWIPCSTTNPSTGTTCSAGSESVGVSFIPPNTGWVQACAAYSSFSDTGVSGVIEQYFQLSKTPDNAQTPEVLGGEVVGAGNRVASTSKLNNFRVCANFFLDSLVRQTIRLKFQHVGSGTISSSSLAGDTASGGRTIHFTVLPLLGRANILSANMVATPPGDGTVHKYALVSAKVASTGTVSNEIGDFINGNCTNASPHVCTFVTNFWKSAPNCWGSTPPSSYFSPVDDATTTSVSTYVYNDAGQASTTSVNSRVFCHGEIN